MVEQKEICRRWRRKKRSLINDKSDIFGSSKCKTKFHRFLRGNEADTDDVHSTENCRGPDTEISIPSIPTPNIDALALSLGVPISSEPTNLYLAIEAEVRWRNEMGSIPMVLEVV